MFIKQHIKLLLLLLPMVGIVTIAEGQNINKPNKMGPLGTQVNTYSGNLFIPRNDFTITARGFDFDISFYYNSYNFTQNNGFGNGWGFAYGMAYKNDTGNSRTITWGSGREDIYTPISGGGYASPMGFFNVFSQYQPGKYLLTEQDGTKYFFDNATHKKITRLEDPNGNFISFNYTDSLLTSMVNKAGQSISLTYNNGLLISITDAVASPVRTYTFTYDANGNLKQVTDPLGGTNKYTYLVNGPMKTISDKNNNVVDIIYYSDFSTSEIIGCNKRISFSYNAVSLISVVTDHLEGSNQVTKYKFENINNQVALTAISGNCCGYNLSFEYDANGNKVKETDANGGVYSYTYDSRGNVLSVIDPLNRKLTYTYEAQYNEITGFTDANGNHYTLNYDTKGNLTQFIEPGGLTYTATYNANGQIISSTDPKGNLYTYSYDALGHPATINQPAGNAVQLQFNGRGNLTAFTDGRGNESKTKYDILDRIQNIINPYADTTHYTYDLQGNVVTADYGINRKSLIAYDASNRVVQFTNPMANKTTYSYDGLNNLTTEKNAIGNATTYTYDSRNRLSAKKDAQGNITSFAYDANGNVIQAVLPGGQKVQFAYDMANRLQSVADESGPLGSLVYDKNNNLIAFTNPTGAITSATYDNLNRLTKLTDPLGTSTELIYDNNENVTSVKNRNGHISSFTYDSLDRIKTYTNNNGAVINLAYDAAGNLLQISDEKNNTTIIAYDSLNRTQKLTYANNTFKQLTFDKNGNVLLRRLSNGSTITYLYDSLNRMTAKTLPDGHQFTFSYDALNRLTSATNNSGTVQITYDALNRVASETFDGRTVNYNYSIAGRSHTTIYPDSTVVTKVYDTRNRLISIAKNNTIIVTYQYNNANQITSQVFGNGIATNMQYDFANRLSSINTANGAIQNTFFTYDNAMNKLAVNKLHSPSLSEQFAYDNAHRLTSYNRGVPGGTPTLQNTYSYDAVGNRTAANINGTAFTYTANNLNQLLTSNSSSQNIVFAYDNNGNLTYDGLFYKTYDAEGRLVKDSSGPLQVLTYAYDALNRRTQKNEFGTVRKYTYSGLKQIEERSSANVILSKNYFTSFIRPVLKESASNNYYYHQNELNSVEAITNGAGTVAETYRYDVYGKPTIYDASNNPVGTSATDNSFAFTGQQYDAATASYKFFARNYSPATGTFFQRDLIGYADGTGLYQYVHNNPANGIDILGLKDCPDQVDNKTETEVAAYLAKIGNYLSILSETLKRLKIESLNLSEDSKFKKLNIITQVTNLTLKIDLLRQNAPNMTEENVNIELAELEVAVLGLGNDLLGDRAAMAAGKRFGPEGAAAVKTASEAISAMGALDAYVQERTGKSLARHYSELDDNAQEFGRKAAKKNQELFEYHEKYLKAVKKIFGEDKKNWTKEALEIDEIHERVKKFNKDNVIVRPKPDCPQKKAPNGTQKPKSIIGPGPNGYTYVNQSWDPNAIIGPEGEPTKRWVSVKDRLPYSITFENAIEASAPAKFVRITTPIEPKQDPATFELSSFGFNNQTFAVPANTASYYNRLDCRDSLGLFVDITAGYDQINNVAFWEFQSIDPLTLLPPPEANRGFLQLQDSTKPLYGHGFANFSIKPRQTAITLDTIGARAAIIFDLNPVIPTNIAMNTIDAFAPTSNMASLPNNSNNPVTLSWGGVDDAGGCGLKFYTLYVSIDGINYNILSSYTTRTDTTFTGNENTRYYFFVLATDSVGNMETLRPGAIQSTFIGAPLPISWLYFKGKTEGKDNLIEWATINEQNSKSFIVERSLNGTNFTEIATLAAAGNSNTSKTYTLTDYRIDKLNSVYMYYRLKQVDLDGRFVYSNIIRLTYNQKDKIKSMVYPNPTEGMITISIGDAKLIGTTAAVYDENGKLLQMVKITANSQTLNLGKYVNGVYYIKLNNKEMLRVIKIQ
jgi:RHS repeat-associated protein